MPRRRRKVQRKRAKETPARTAERIIEFLALGQGEGQFQVHLPPNWRERNKPPDRAG